MYKEIKNNLCETDTKAGNDLEEICSYIYDDCNGDIDNFPDKEQMEYIADVTGREYNQIKKMVATAIENVADHLYNYDRYGKENIELSDRATIAQLYGNIDNVDPEETQHTFENLRDQAFKNFEDETGVEIFQDGRSGRHIVVENNFDNAYNYNKLCAAQEKWEDWVIDEFAKAYPFPDDAVENNLEESDENWESITADLVTRIKDSVARNLNKCVTLSDVRAVLQGKLNTVNTYLNSKEYGDGNLEATDVVANFEKLGYGRNKEDYMEALNKISELENNGEIDKEDYDKYIKQLQSLYNSRRG